MESKIFIGLPVFNAEKTLRRTINSVISQTFEDFTLLISDNDSTDSTSLICKEFEKIDLRIQYVKQNENIGWLDNFLYLLNQANSKYFVWIASDDFWEPIFLEKNIKILESKPDIVGSIGKIGIIGDYYNKFNFNKNDNFFQNFYKKIRRHYLSLELFDIHGITYEERINSCLKSSRYGLLLFSIFRTDILRKSVNFSVHPWDWGLVLILLKYGNIHVINEILIHRSLGGASNTNAIKLYLDKKIKFKQILFPKTAFTKWFIKNVGIKSFIQNIRFFIKLNFSGPIIIFLDLIKFFKLSNSGKSIRKKKGLPYS